MASPPPPPSSPVLRLLCHPLAYGPACLRPDISRADRDRVVRVTSVPRSRRSAAVTVGRRSAGRVWECVERRISPATTPTRPAARSEPVRCSARLKSHPPCSSAPSLRCSVLRRLCLTAADRDENEGCALEAVLILNQLLWCLGVTWLTSVDQSLTTLS